MKTKILTIAAASLLSVLFTSCYKFWRIEGNHHVVNQNRNVPEFYEIVSEGDFYVSVINDSIKELSVEAEENLLPFIETFVSDNKLIVRTKRGKNIKNHNRMIIKVRSPQISGLHLSGSGKIEADTLKTNELTVKISGSGNIDLGAKCGTINANISGSGEINISGTSDKTNFDISGSGNINSYFLSQNLCYASIDGSGSIYATVEKYISVNISGSGNFHYYGNPTVETHIKGSGKVVRH
ncbi:MAG: DUF2807 domain-containing protein [Bacteroidales bacterium]|nr:DUF2807 domain-containing protein [Bacteroidales bacterium]